jgi:hypothetical protein
LSHVDQRIRDVLVVNEIYSSTLWAPRRELVNRSRDYRLTFEVPATLKAEKAILLGSQDGEAMVSYDLYPLKDGRFIRQLYLSAGTRFQYHYLIDDKPYKDHGADDYIHNGADIEQSVLVLPDKPRRVRRVAGMTGEALRGATPRS